MVGKRRQEMRSRGRVYGGKVAPPAGKGGGSLTAGAMFYTLPSSSLLVVIVITGTTLFAGSTVPNA